MSLDLCLAWLLKIVRLITMEWATSIINVPLLESHIPNLQVDTYSIRPIQKKTNLCQMIVTTIISVTNVLSFK